MESTLVETFVAVIAANFITAWAIYFMWRIKRNESDWPAIGGMLFICLIVVVSAYALRYPT